MLTFNCPAPAARQCLAEPISSLHPEHPTIPSTPRSPSIGNQAAAHRTQLFLLFALSREAFSASSRVTNLGSSFAAQLSALLETFYLPYKLISRTCFLMCNRCLLRQGRLPWGLLCLTGPIVGSLPDRRCCKNTWRSGWIFAFPFHGDNDIFLKLYESHFIIP